MAVLEVDTYLEGTAYFDSVHIRHDSDAEVVRLEESLQNGTMLGIL